MNAMQIQVAADAPGRLDQARPHVFDLVGGKRGAVDGGLPPLVFVIVNAVAGAHTTRPAALAAAIGAAVVTGLVILALRPARREPPPRSSAVTIPGASRSRQTWSFDRRKSTQEVR